MIGADGLQQTDKESRVLDSGAGAWTAIWKWALGCAMMRRGSFSRSGGFDSGIHLV